LAAPWAGPLQKNSARAKRVVVLAADGTQRLCADVNGAVEGERLPTGVTMAEITLTKSVLHRPGQRPDDGDGPCAADCRRLTR
jgi:hypothetical protein